MTNNVQDIKNLMGDVGPSRSRAKGTTKKAPKAGAKKTTGRKTTGRKAAPKKTTAAKKKTGARSRGK